MSVDPLFQARIATARLIRAAREQNVALVRELSDAIAPAPFASEPRPEANLREAQLLARTVVGLPSPGVVPPDFTNGHALRAGHLIRASGEISPALAEMLAVAPVSGTKYPASGIKYPDHAVTLALQRGDRQQAALNLLDSPFRWLTREPEAIVRIGGEVESAEDPCLTGWQRVVDALDPEAPVPGGSTSGDSSEVGAALAMSHQSLDAATLVEWLDRSHRLDGRDHWIALESLALRHAARLVNSKTKPVQVRQAWQLGHLVRSAVVESPFFGADSEILSARLSGILATVPTESYLNADPLWPARLAGIDLGELLGISVLGQRDNLDNLPRPLRAALERLAARNIGAPEMDAEVALSKSNQLEWPLRHVAPPLAARWLLHKQGQAWFGELIPSAQDETLNVLASFWPSEPERVRWILYGLDRELRKDGQLQDGHLTTLVNLISDSFATAQGDDIAALALVGSAIHAQHPQRLAQPLTDPAFWIARALDAGPRWLVGLLRTFAERSEQLREVAVSALARALHDQKVALPAATALVGLARARFISADSLHRLWDDFPDALRRDPELLREYQRVRRAG